MSADNANKIDISPLTVVVSEALDPRVRRKLEAEQQADVKTYEELTRSMQVQEDLNKIRQQVDSKDDDEADPFKQPEATENTAPAQEPANPAPAPAPEATPAPAPAPEAGAQPAAAPATTEQPAAAPATTEQPAAAPTQSATPAPTPAEPAANADGQKKVEQNAAIDKYARKFVSTWSGMFRKEISLSGSLLTHAMKVGQVFLTYGERSVAQYGS